MRRGERERDSGNLVPVHGCRSRTTQTRTKMENGNAEITTSTRADGVGETGAVKSGETHAEENIPNGEG